MAENIKSSTGRKALAVRREPYWERLAKGVYLGYRAAEAGKGTWIARLRDEDGKQKYHALGSQIDFDLAAKAARAWAESVEQGVQTFDTNVSDACASYLEWLKLNRTATTVKLVESCFTRLVHGQTIGRIPLAKLQTRHVSAWLNAQVDLGGDEDEVRRDKVTANRQLDCLKGALNKALSDRLVATDAGWKTIKRFEKVARRRERFLTLAERTELLKHCDSDLRAFCTALLLTGARPGELANADIGDFEPEQGTLTLEGKTGRRTVSLSTAAIAHFKAVARDRIGRQSLLIREDGKRWDKETWKRAFKRAVRAAGLPDDVVVYNLRHAAISEFIAGGMDSFLVAKLAGTSTDMIDRYYGHLRHDRTRESMDAVRML